MSADERGDGSLGMHAVTLRSADDRRYPVLR
jgi:hypothetical protein